MPLNSIGTVAQVNTNSTQKNSGLINPDISIHGLFLGRAGNNGSESTSENPNGFSLQEVEMRFTSNIDAYFRGDVLLAIEKEPGEEFKLEPEEVFVETLSLTIKA